MGIYGYNCYNFCHNNSFGGSAYVSGTTCDGIVGAYTLTLGQCICMDLDFPIITCDNPIFSGECVPNTPTPTATPTMTMTPTITSTATVTPTASITPTPSATPCICFPAGSGFNYTQQSVSTIAIDNTLNRLYVGGLFSSYNGISQNSFAALDLTSSSLIPAFNLSGIPMGSVSDIIVENDSKIILAYNGNTWKGVTAPARLMKLNSDGTRDTGFVLGTGFTGSVGTLFKDSSNRLLVGGNFTHYNGSAVPVGLIRLNSANGSVDTTFSGITSGFTFPAGAFSSVLEILEDGTGGYFVSGNFNTYNGVACNDVLRLNSDGSLNTSFNAISASGSSRIIDIAVDPVNQRVYGVNIPVEGFINAYNYSGNTIWSAATGGVEVNFIDLQSDGKLIIGARQITSGANMYRYTSGGTVDATFVSPTFVNANQPANGINDIISTDNNNCYIAGGAFISVNGFIGTQVLRVYGNGSLDVCNPILVSPTPTPSVTRTPTATIGTTPTQTPSNSATPTITPTNTGTPAVTPTNTSTPTSTPPDVTPTTTATNTPTNTPSETPTQTPSSTPPSVTPTTTTTSTATPTPSSSPSICGQQVYISAQQFTCSNFCTVNYTIGTPQAAENAYAGLTIGDFLCGLGGGYYAYSDVSTDTATGPFRIADVDGTGEILGIYVCSGGSCVPL